MENLNDFNSLLDAYYGEGDLIALMKDGSLKPVTHSTNPADIYRFADKEDIEKKIITQAFGTDKLGTAQYELIIRLFKIIHTNVASTTKDRMMKKYRLKVTARKGFEDVID